jgi:hypothetical protein
MELHLHSLLRLHCIIPKDRDRFTFILYLSELQWTLWAQEVDRAGSGSCSLSGFVIMVLNLRVLIVRGLFNDAFSIVILRRGLISLWLYQNQHATGLKEMHLLYICTYPP